MKITWGHKIAFTFLIFVSGIAFLVIKANYQKFDLVTKDYYGEELKYQQVIDQSANAAKLSAPVAVQKNGHVLSLLFPEEMKGKKKQIDFYLYFPADASRDFRKILNTEQQEIIQELPGNFSGNYELKLSWKADSLKYYFEKKVSF
ncbi:MAG: FixH family protein [Bacteroidetes bacterium]|nr:FixH family protein [Bacteroidota bacterium]MBS1931217.1 FixH family protein [Bacteroidota bacterium]